ncbi:sulfotransferase domain-containing protein [Pseudoalteromonas carrageenovora]|uniref:sulfotransferase domain-containing protein n=1 Tax=Pseudoalteromonas carrageenovora TaxID=227 RepID=UPI00311D6E7B
MSSKNSSNFAAANEFVEFGLSEKLQGRRESASGPGSYVSNTLEVRELLKNTVNEKKVASILDLGCGDWNWMSSLMFELRISKRVNYIGWDANLELVEELMNKFSDQNTFFYQKDLVTEDFPDVDLIILRDVLFHLHPKVAAHVLQRVKNSGARWLISTSYDTKTNQDELSLKNNNNINNWYFHLINLNIAPYNMKSLEVERVKEVNNSHAGKSRYSVLYDLKDSGTMIENLFLSVGAMKAGTTWLYEQLKDHPEIHFTPEKEIHYFANKVGIENQLNHRNRILKLKEVMQKNANANAKFISQNLDEISWYADYAHDTDISNEWYKSLFKFNPSKKFCADFSNLYCQMDTNGWDNVRKIAKNVKVIYTLRDPLERLWSHYKFHMKWVNREDEALDAGFENFKELLDKHFFWVNAEYAKNFELLKQSLNDDELMVLYFEDFRERPVEMLNEVQRFLGIKEIEPEQSQLNKKVNKTKSFKMPFEWKQYALSKLQSEIAKQKKLGLGTNNWLEGKL